MTTQTHFTDTTLPYADRLSGCRSYYNELQACQAMPKKLAAAWKLAHDFRATGISSLKRGGYDATNRDLYDIVQAPGGVVLVLVQHRNAYKKKADWYTQISKTYEIYAARRGVARYIDVDITGQGVHASIRAGRSPINKLLERKDVREAIELAMAAPAKKAA